MMTRLMAAFTTVMLALPALSRAEEAQHHIGIASPRQLGFQEPVTPVMERLYALHDYLLVIITLITLFVLGLLAYACVRFHHKRNPNPSKTTHNATIEVIWTVVPILILAAIFIPSYKLHYDCMHTLGCPDDGVPAAPDMTLKIVGYQWYWGYEYPDAGIEYTSYMKQDHELLQGEPRLLAVDNPVVVPVNANVRLHITGGDVIHNWAMPAFGIKMDAIPGRLNETWFRAQREGTYYGQCSELCGRLHGFMPIQVEVVSQAFYEEWLALASENVEAASKLVASLRGRLPEEPQLATITQ
jgi:cytochrome c oxidase subunit II